jgi:hypothetical protein
MSLKNTLQLTINPFRVIAGWKSLFFGLTVIFSNALLGTAVKAHYDGVLDIHFGGPNPFNLSLFEHLVSWLSLALVLYLAGILISKSNIRLIDVLGTTALARYPLLLAIPAGFSGISNPTLMFENPTSAGLFIAVAIFLLLLVGFHIFLLFNAYQVSCNLKGRPLVISFIVGVITAEIISKFLIYQYFKTLYL